MNNLLVSVIIPAYNTAPYIGRMLDCVINQTYKNIEIIVVNDGSTDDTLSIVENYAKKDNRFVVIDIPNGGVSNARNVGIKKSKGEKIFFWDSDDVIEHTAIEKCLDYSLKHCVNAVAYGYANIQGKPHKTILGGGVNLLIIK